VRSRFDAVAEMTIRELIGVGWGIVVEELREVLEGGGAHHWSAWDTTGRRWFVTCDDLTTKPWLGADSDAVFDQLLAAYGAAIDLRQRGQMSVVAPIPSCSEAPAERLDERHSLAVFEHVDGKPGRWGQPLRIEAMHELVAVLAELHLTVTTTPIPIHHSLQVPGVAAFDAALAATNRPWNNGPLSESARHVLHEHLDLITVWLDQLSTAAAQLAATPRRFVVTHGEPHPGNLIHTASGLRIVDWDTVALAPPERDLWMIADIDPTLLTHYLERTATIPDDHLLTTYRLLWAVTDLAAFTAQLRAPHPGNADDKRALCGLSDLLARQEPRPYGTPIGR
jgi:spectinomycin phosphotransferase